MRRPERILIIRRKAVGDILVSLAVAEELRRRWPRVHLEMVVDRFAADLLAEYATLDDLLVHDPRSTDQGPLRQRAAALLGWIRRLRAGRYDVVLDLMGTPQTAAWTRSTGAPVRVGRARRGRAWAYTHLLPARGDARFAGEVFLDWVRALGVIASPWRPVPPVPPRPRSPLRGRPARVVLNPSMSWPAKAWPLQHFRELAARLSGEEGAEVCVAWGPGEEPLRDAIVEGGRATALPPTGLRELARELEEADLVIGTDSGPKHLAVAMGTPTLTLFGSTDPRGWQPPIAGHRALTHPVDCHPCNLRECPVPGHPCLDDLRPATVARTAAAMLASRARGAREVRP